MPRNRNPTGPSIVTKSKINLMKYVPLFFVLAICALAAPKVEVKALVESYCPDCIAFTAQELKTLTETEDIMEITDLEIVPYGKAHIVSRDPPKFTCQHGEKECYGNKVELCGLGYFPEHGLNLMNCMQSAYNFDDSTVEACAEKEGVDAKLILKCAKGEEGDQLMLHAGDITPKLSYVPSVMVNGQVFTDPENVIRHICDAYEGEKPKSCTSWKLFRCYN